MKCSICKERTFKHLLKKDNLILVKCLNCGLVQIGNIVEISDIKNYDYYKNKITLTQKELYNPITTKRYINLLSKLEYYRKNNTLLDIGCGEGQFLSVAKEKKWQIEGIEIAPHAVAICKKFDDIDNIYCGNFLGLDLKHDYYDVITMFEVLEHLTQPKDFLLKSHSILRKGGVLYLTTPNFNCINRLLLQKKWRCIHKEHLFYFTHNLLKRIIKEANFKILEFETKHIDLPELFNVFRREPSNKFYSSNNCLRENIERSRILSISKEITNKFLNIIKLGESIQCLCQKA